MFDAKVPKESNVITVNKDFSFVNKKNLYDDTTRNQRPRSYTV